MGFAVRVDSHRTEEGRSRGLRGLLRWLKFLVVCVGLGMRCGAAGVRPNIVLILADDLGVHDLGCYGADLHETPAIDGLAREGMQFLRAYSPSPVCTPTRASLMTGKHPARLRMTIWSEGSLKGPTDRRMLQADSRHDLPRTEVGLLRKNGQRKGGGVVRVFWTRKGLVKGRRGRCGGACGCRRLR
jgi:hypothetical protein